LVKDAAFCEKQTTEANRSPVKKERRFVFRLTFIYSPEGFLMGVPVLTG
jgi:hypothetical protein